MKIGDKTLSEWQEFARRDDCLDRMVPSDLRVLIGEIGRLRAREDLDARAAATLADAYGPDWRDVLKSVIPQV